MNGSFGRTHRFEVVDLIRLSRRERGAHRLRVVRIFEVEVKGELGGETDMDAGVCVGRGRGLDDGMEGGGGIRAIARGMADDDDP